MTIEPANRMAALPASFFQTLNARLRRLQAAKVDVIRNGHGLARPAAGAASHRHPAAVGR